MSRISALGNFWTGLDEPTNGLDPQGIAEIRELIKQLAAEGTTVFISSHLLHEVELTCNRIGIVNQGKLLVEDEISALLSKVQTSKRIRLRVTPVEAARDWLSNQSEVSDLFDSTNCSMRDCADS